MDSPTIAISVSPAPPKGKSGKDQASDEDANAFSISLEVARDEADGDTETTSITIQGLVTESDASDTDAADTEADITIEIETVVFSGDGLAENLTASALIDGGNVSVTEDGAFGVSGSISGDNEVRLEVGETLTFELPPAEGEVIGGQVTITNLFSDGETTEGALVFAYDADDRQLACYCAIGDETGSVTVDIDVPFARLDFKALDNASPLLQNNSNFGVSDISAMFASVIEDLSEGASQLIDDIVTKAGSHLAGLVDIGHFGTVQFEVTRISSNQVATIDALSSVRVEQDSADDSNLGRRPYAGLDGQGSSEAWLAERRYAG